MEHHNIAGIKFVTECGDIAGNRTQNLRILADNNCSIQVVEKTLRRLLFGSQRPVLQSHLIAVALPAPCSRDRILGPTLEAYLEEQPSLLCNLLLCCICDWHLLYCPYSKEGSFLPFCSYYFTRIYKRLATFCCYPTTRSYIVDDTIIVEHF